MQVGNQQFTIRNLTVNNANTGELFHTLCVASLSIVSHDSCIWNMELGLVIQRAGQVIFLSEHTLRFYLSGSYHQ